MHSPLLHLNSPAKHSARKAVLKIKINKRPTGVNETVRGVSFRATASVIPTAMIYYESLLIDASTENASIFVREIEAVDKPVTALVAGDTVPVGALELARPALPVSHRVEAHRRHTAQFLTI
jgi:hypothetical protein